METSMSLVTWPLVSLCWPFSVLLSGFDLRYICARKFFISNFLLRIMQITVKKLNGQEVRLEVSENDQISSVKRQVFDKLHIPVAQQRLVFKGKTLGDSSILCEHQIVEGSKLHLSVRKPGDGAASAEDPNEFFAQLRDLLKQHFSAQDTEKVMAKFKEDFKIWVCSLSLDDIERMAALHMNESSDSQ